MDGVPEALVIPAQLLFRRAEEREMFVAEQLHRRPEQQHGQKPTPHGLKPPEQRNLSSISLCFPRKRQANQLFRRSLFVLPLARGRKAMAGIKGDGAGILLQRPKGARALFHRKVQQRLAVSSALKAGIDVELVQLPRRRPPQTRGSRRHPAQRFRPPARSSAQNSPPPGSPASPRRNNRRRERWDSNSAGC